jgi:hypothetical protein
MLLAGIVMWLASCDGGGGGGLITLGQFCDSSGTAFCNRAVTCGSVTSFDACFQAFKGGCCLQDGTCDQTLADTAAFETYKSNCNAALMSEACSDVMAAVTPAACLMAP